MIPGRVSVGIPTYGRRKMVRQAIDSVLGQTYADIEVVVVDDGSRDGTWETIQAYSNLHGDKVRCIQFPQNRGIAAAKNAALRAGTGEFSAILDDDDYYAPLFIESCVAELREHPEVGVVYVDDYLVTDNRRVIAMRPALEWSLEEFLKTRNLRGDAWVARRAVLDQTQFHDERFKMEVDYDLFYQLAEVTELRRVPKPLLFVRKHRGQTTERDRRVPAYWHAAGLAKYGHPIRYAYERAEAFGMLPDWRTSIMAGYEFGERCRDEHWSRGIIEVAKRRAEYQEYQRAYYQEIYEKAAAFLKIGGDVLDVGCGDGSGRNFNPQIRHYTGIDVLLTSPSPDLVQGNAEELPFPDERFEGVLCYSVLQHVREPERALDEIRRVLRPGGRFASLTCVDDPNPIFCWQWGRTDVLRLLAARFVVEDHQVLDKRHLLVNARKP